VKEARAAGFEPSGTSEINANPKDDRTFPEWFLPPLLRVADQDKAKYEAMGEADETVLRFTKSER